MWPNCDVVSSYYKQIKMYHMAPISKKVNEIHAVASLQDKLFCQFYSWPLNTRLSCRSHPSFRSHLDTPLEIILRNLGYFVPNIILALANLLLGVFGKLHHFQLSTVLYYYCYLILQIKNEAFDCLFLRPFYDI